MLGRHVFREYARNHLRPGAVGDELVSHLSSVFDGNYDSDCQNLGLGRVVSREAGFRRFVFRQKPSPDLQLHVYFHVKTAYDLKIDIIMF